MIASAFVRMHTFFEGQYISTFTKNSFIGTFGTLQQQTEINKTSDCWTACNLIFGYAGTLLVGFCLLQFLLRSIMTCYLGKSLDHQGTKKHLDAEWWSITERLFIICNYSEGFLKHSWDDTKKVVKNFSSIWWFEMTNPAGNLTIWPSGIVDSFIPTLICNWIGIYLLGKILCPWNNWALMQEEKKSMVKM